MADNGDADGGLGGGLSHGGGSGLGDWGLAVVGHGAVDGCGAVAGDGVGGEGLRLLLLILTILVILGVFVLVLSLALFLTVFVTFVVFVVTDFRRDGGSSRGSGFESGLSGSVVQEGGHNEAGGLRSRGGLRDRDNGLGSSLESRGWGSCLDNGSDAGGISSGSHAANLDTGSLSSGNNAASLDAGGLAAGASRSGGEQAGNASPGGLLLVLVVVDESLTGTAEGVGHPAVLVRDSPDGHTHAALDVKAGSDHVGKVVTLGLESGLGGGDRGVADVELSVGDLDVESSEALQDSGEVSARGGLADDKVTLEADTVDGGTGVLDDLNELKGALCLGTVALEVVVVVVPEELDVEQDQRGNNLQPGIGIRLAGGVERDGKVVSAESLVEDAIPPVTIVTNGLINHVPSIAVALVVTNNVGDVSFNDGCKFLFREAATRHYNSQHHSSSKIQYPYPSWEAGCAKSEHGNAESVRSSWQGPERRRPFRKKTCRWSAPSSPTSDRSRGRADQTLPCRRRGPCKPRR